MNNLTINCGSLLYQRLMADIENFINENEKFSSRFETSIGFPIHVDLQLDTSLPSKSYHFSFVDSNNTFSFIETMIEQYLDEEHKYYEKINEMLFRQIEGYLRKQVMMHPDIWSKNIASNPITLEMHETLLQLLNPIELQILISKINEITNRHGAPSVYIFISDYLHDYQYNVWFNERAITGSWFDAESLTSNHIYDEIIITFEECIQTYFV